MHISPQPRPAAPPASGWRAHTPNALTAARLGMTALIIAALAAARPATDHWNPALIIATALFILAAATDAADGYLARKWNAVSRFGRVADPFADKLLILSGFVMLAGPTLGPASGVQPWMVVLILARELLVTTIRGVYEGEGIDFSASRAGKFKMILQSVAIPVAILDAAAPAQSHAPTMFTTALLWLTVTVTVWSAAPYIARARHADRDGPRPSPHDPTQTAPPKENPAGSQPRKTPSQDKA